MNQARKTLDVAIHKYGKASVVISPYLTSLALRYITDNSLETSVFTRCDFENFVDMSSDVQALEYAANNNMKIYHVDKLHAKIYAFEDRALVGSANCTNRGLSLGKPSNCNIEFLAMIGRSNVDPFIELLAESGNLFTNSDLQNLLNQLMMADRLDFVDNRGFIEKTLQHCVFPEWCSYGKYEQVMCEEIVGLPADIFRSLHSEIDLLGLQPTFRSKTAFRKEMSNTLLKCEPNRILASLFSDHGEVTMKQILASLTQNEEYRQRILYWCRWLSREAKLG